MFRLEKCSALLAGKITKFRPDSMRKLPPYRGGGFTWWREIQTTKVSQSPHMLIFRQATYYIVLWDKNIDLLL